MSLDARLSSQVDVEHPWLGLESFSESTRSYFFGREAEAAELLQRLRLHPLLVLYGRSGLGKTSLLRAKLLPDLEKLGARPAFYRISYRKGGNSPLDQLAVVLEAGEHINMPGFALPEDAASRLWLHLHRREHKDRITHLILDQFEEIFTLGSELPGADAEVSQALAILVQGAIPPPVETLLDEGETFLKQFRLDVLPLPVLLSVRQDYVFALNRWRSHLPQLGQNYFELHPLRGPAAFEAVFKPGKLRCHYRSEISKENEADTGLPPIASEETVQRIVRFVAQKGEEIPIEEIEAVPPILSLLCRELNERRFTKPVGTPEAPATQIAFRESEADIATIIAAFYERCLAGRPDAVRIFIEEELVSPYSGARLQQDERSILKVFAYGCKIPGTVDDRRAAGYGDSGAARACLEDLVNQRLLTAVGGGENPSYELVHDLLAAVVEKSRTGREAEQKIKVAEAAAIEAKNKAEERARQRTQALVFGGVSLLLAIISLALAGWVYHSNREIQNLNETKNRLQLGIAEINRSTQTAFKGVGKKLARFQDLALLSLEDILRTKEHPLLSSDEIAMLQSAIDAIGSFHITSAGDTAAEPSDSDMRLTRRIDFLKQQASTILAVLGNDLESALDHANEALARVQSYDKDVDRWEMQRLRAIFFHTKRYSSRSQTRRRHNKNGRRP
jgi:hypothetical protein